MTQNNNNNNSTQNVQEESDFLQIKELFYLCLAKWHWFVASFVLCVCLAVGYLLITPPVFTRSAAILIKDESKGKSASPDLNSFADMGLLVNNTNVNNEIGILQSPDLMQEVVLLLDLNMDYRVPGTFHKKTVYGSTLPVTVKLVDFPADKSAAFTLDLKKDGSVRLSDFEIKDMDEVGIAEGKLNDTIFSDIGRIVVAPTRFYSDSVETVFVNCNSIKGTVEAFSKRTTISLTDKKANIIALSIQDVSTERAEDVLNALIAVYNQNWIKDKNQIAVSTSDFINERLEVIEKELGNVDDDISSFKSKNMLPDVQAAANMYMLQANETNESIQNLSNQIYITQYIRKHLSDDKNKFQLLPASSGIDNQNIANQITEYNKQVLERNSLISHSSEKNPLVMELNTVLESMRQALVSSIDNQLVALDEQSKSLQDQNRKILYNIASNPKQAKHLLSIERQQKVKESLFIYLLQKREENELSKAFSPYNTRIITKPGGSDLPSSPVKKIVLLAAAVIGLLLPAGFIFVRENLITTVRGRKDLDGLQIPFIGEMPLVKKNKKDIIKEDNASTEKMFVVKEGNRNVVNEAFRILRTNIEFMTQSGSNSNVIAVTSFNPGSGKSFLSMNMALCFAINKKRVLVIDGDMRHASTSAYIGSPQPGLSDFLSGRTDSIEKISYPCEEHDCMTVIPVGSIPPNPTELLLNGKLGSLIEAVREQYDYVFLDCPPIELVADTQIIEQFADRTIFVIRAGLLERSMLPELNALYTDKKYKNMAMILNGTKSETGRYGYKYGYRYGYSENYHYGSND